MFTLSHMYCEILSRTNTTLSNVFRVMKKSVTMSPKNMTGASKIDESLLSLRPYNFLVWYYDGSELSNFYPYNDRGALPHESSNAI